MLVSEYSIGTLDLRPPAIASLHHNQRTTSHHLARLPAQEGLGDWRKETRRISISFDDIDSARALRVVEQLLD
jgi:hypothetical protein